MLEIGVNSVIRDIQWNQKIEKCLWQLELIGHCGFTKYHLSVMIGRKHDRGGEDLRFENHSVYFKRK
jgi:hypothetical protein